MSTFFQRLTLVAVLLTTFTSYSQITVDNSSMTVEQFVQNVFLGSGTTVSNIQFNGGPANIVNEQVGEFNDPNSDVGFTNGLILGSGDVTMASQPNTSGSSGAGGTGATGNDTDLANITADQVFDECVIEFDFVPSGDSISFQYTFASEEYDEYVCATFNDAFGFFLTGTNPAGGTYTASNIALIPDPNNPSQFTTTPVSINTVNLGVAGSNGNAATCAAVDPNWASYNVFYTQNNTGNYEYDGRTVTLTATAAVNCGETYHIKLAIGDAGDAAFDSGVFLEGQSFNSSGLSISASVSQIYEGCPGAYYVITRPDTVDHDTIGLIIQGDATNGTDYDFINDTIYFDDGALTDTIWVNVSSTDGDTNALQVLEIFINDSSACGGPTINILQADPLEVSINPGDTICTQDPFNQSHTFIATVTGGVPGGYGYDWISPNYDFGTSNGQDNITVNPANNEWFYVNVSDACGSFATSEQELIYLECDLEIPNIFTPNGDGFNDFFEIINIDHYPNAILEIYNRWGNQIFKKENGYNNDWDGGEFSDGVYFYILIPNGYTNEINPIHGQVHIAGSQN
jgi:gliding motility-associated-like protein